MTFLKGCKQTSRNLRHNKHHNRYGTINGKILKKSHRLKTEQIQIIFLKDILWCVITHTWFPTKPGKCIIRAINMLSLFVLIDSLEAYIPHSLHCSCVIWILSTNIYMYLTILQPIYEKVITRSKKIWTGNLPQTALDQSSE